MNIILIGPPGSGKTSVGQLLAERNQRRFFDSDRVIEERAGAKVASIFSEFGESHFRALETRLLDEISDKSAWSNIVLATGGGIVTTPGNFERLDKIGAVVCLLASAECLVERLNTDESRPLLAADNPQLKLKRISDLLENRMAMYKQARYIVETADLTPEGVAKRIEKLLSLSDMTRKRTRTGIECSDEI